MNIWKFHGGALRKSPRGNWNCHSHHMGGRRHSSASTSSSVRASLSAMECPFCAIARGELAASVVLRDEQVVAFMDTRPVFKGHVLVAAREHVPDLLELPRTLLEPLFFAVQRIARTAASWR